MDFLRRIRAGRKRREEEEAYWAERREMIKRELPIRREQEQRRRREQDENVEGELEHIRSDVERSRIREQEIVQHTEDLQCREQAVREREAENKRIHDELEERRFDEVIKGIKRDIEFQEKVDELQHREEEIRRREAELRVEEPEVQRRDLEGQSVGVGHAELLDWLQSLSPGSFEWVCKRLLVEMGVKCVKVVGQSGDGGIDLQGVYVEENLNFKIPIVAQCKRYGDGLNVTPKEIRDFRGAMDGRARRGYFITTGGFTKSARDEVESMNGGVIMDHEGG